MAEHTQNRMLCAWSLAALLTMTCLVVWTSMERFRDPVMDKYVLVMPPGNADFFFPFGGARALVLGKNPYLNDIPGLEDPWLRRVELVNGKEYRGLYPPTHFILYVPLALITDDWRQAGRILFVANVAALLLLAILSWWLIVRLGNLKGQEQQWSVLLIPLGFAILAGNVGSSYALERGDGGDILAAALCWTALVLFLKERRFLAMFLVVPAMFTKGYPVLCGLGLFLLSLDRRSWRRSVTGAIAGVAVFVLPVVQYLPDALTWLQYNKPISGGSVWWNHGFRNFFYHLSPAFAEPGRWIMGSYCVVLSIACWLRAKRGLRQHDAVGSTLWSTLFVTCSLEIFIGIAPFSYIYNLVLVLPGMLIFFLAAPSLARNYGFPEGVIHAVGALNVLSAFFVFKFVLFDMSDFPSPGIGMVLFLLSLGLVILGRRQQRLIAIPRPARTAA